MAKPQVSLNEFDMIYAMSIQAGRSTNEIARMIGRASSTVRRIIQFMKALEAGDIDTAWNLFPYMNADIALEWAKTRKGIEIPREEETPPEPQETPQKEIKDDNGDKFLLRILTEQAAQTAILREISKDIKSYGQAITTNTQRCGTARMPENFTKALADALEGCAGQVAAHVTGEIKDNLNANFDALGMPEVLDTLKGIKVNTRKKGL